MGADVFGVLCTSVRVWVEAARQPAPLFFGCAAFCRCLAVKQREAQHRTRVNSLLRGIPGMDVLVAFVGRVRSWRLIWADQLLWLSATLPERGASWGSVACLDASDSSPTAEMVAALRLTAVAHVDLTAPAVNLTAPWRGVHEPDHGTRWRATHPNGPHASLRRLSVCGPFVRRWCVAVQCASLLYLRPDLFFPPPHVRRSTMPLLLDAPDAPPQVFARIKCASPPLFTIDDQIAIMTSRAIPHYFALQFQPATSIAGATTRACPATATWAEGQLTETLLSSNVTVRELRDVYHAAIYRETRTEPWLDPFYSLACKPKVSLSTRCRTVMPCRWAKAKAPLTPLATRSKRAKGHHAAARVATFGASTASRVSRPVGCASSLQPPSA